MTKALIDFDLVAFRSSASAEEEDAGIAIYRMTQLLDRILETVKCEEYEAFLTGDYNARKDIYPEYKANRTAPRPRHLHACREYAMKKLGVVLAPEGLEADDSLGMAQTDDTIICSLDKDLLMIPGRHFQWAIKGNNWEKPDTFLTQTYLEGQRLFYKQCIQGDASDNIKGVKGAGKKKAEEVLNSAKTEQEMFDKVRKLYNNEEEFIMNARVLWIKRKMEESFGDVYAELTGGHHA